MINLVKRFIESWKTWSENRYFRIAISFIQQLFVTLLITYLLILLVEAIFPDSVSRYLNLNYFLIAVVATGIIAVLTRQESRTDEEGRHITVVNIIVFVCIGLFGAALIWYQTREIGWFAYLVSLAGGILIILLSLLIWSRNEAEYNEEGYIDGEDSPDN